MNASTPILFTTVERFASGDEGWDGYTADRSFVHVREVVTVDDVLGKDCLDDLRREDWDHNYPEDWIYTLFQDLEYLFSRVPCDERNHTLALMREPRKPPHELFSDPRFEFVGYEIMDGHFGQSVITNCGQIPDVFSDAELSEYGLLSDMQRAYEVQKAAAAKHPDCDHLGNCQVWAVWRMKQDARRRAIEALGSRR